MISLKLDKKALEHRIVSLYTNDNVEIDEDLSNEILLKTPCYDLAITKDYELVELECDVEAWEKINSSLFKGTYSFEGERNITFSEVQNIIKEKISAL